MSTISRRWRATGRVEATWPTLASVAADNDLRNPTRLFANLCPGCFSTRRTYASGDERYYES